MIKYCVKYEFQEPRDIQVGFCKEHKSYSKYLNTNLKDGLTSEQVLLNREIFGENDREVFEETPLYQFLLDPFEDPILLLLVFAAFLSMVLGVVKESIHEGHFEFAGAYEGLAILVAVVVVDLVSAYNNWKKEQEFKKLQESYAKTQKFFVIRDGKEQEIEFDEIVIGDVLKLNYGTQCPVDCILIRFDGQSLKVDESSVTGESDLITKCTLNDVMNNSSGESDIEPSKRFSLIISGSTINEGTAYGLVLTVGANTYIRTQTKLETNEESPLMEKLEIIANQIGRFGMFTAILIIIIIWIKLIIQILVLKTDI